MNIRSIKFGGTSMGSARSILECASIVQEKSKQYKLIVSVSAVAGVTDTLIKIIALARKQKPKLVSAEIIAIEKTHRNILKYIINDKRKEESVWAEKFENLFLKLRTIAQGTSLVGDLTTKTEAQICAFGEKLSSILMCEALDTIGISNTRIESEKIIRTDSNYLSASVIFQNTISLCRKHLNPIIKQKKIPVVTGFIAKDTKGDTTLLGRGGSDYTASILAIALKADAVEIWTDVDGIMSADPRSVKNVVHWPCVDINLMSEMAYSGAKVVHPDTITLALKQNIPVYVYNSFNKTFEGTKITTKTTQDVKGVVANPKNTIITLQHPNIIDRVGFISRVSTLVASYNIPIDVCATSEVSLSFSISSNDFSQKLCNDLKEIAQISVIQNVTKICIIGHNITLNTSLLAGLFTLFSSNKIRTHIISASSSYHNLTVMIDDSDKTKILPLAHNLILEQQ
ncbi:MAG: aspartate kinase [Rickettsiales bacterium]|nr:aspartate kinase [Rickettsiales bacterium]